MSIIFLIVQMLLYISYIYFYFKIKNDIKSNPPKIQKFKIEEEEDESNYNSSKIKNDSDGIKKPLRFIMIIIIDMKIIII